MRQWSGNNYLLDAMIGEQFSSWGDRFQSTIGPASESSDGMGKMIRAGMNIARLNFSYGDFDNHRVVICNLKATARSAEKRLANMAGISGPKMRIGGIEDVSLVDIKIGHSL